MTWKKRRYLRRRRNFKRSSKYRRGNRLSRRVLRHPVMKDMSVGKSSITWFLSGTTGVAQSNWYLLIPGNEMVIEPAFGATTSWSIVDKMAYPQWNNAVFPYWTFCSVNASKISVTAMATIDAGTVATTAFPQKYALAPIPGTFNNTTSSDTTQFERVRVCNYSKAAYTYNMVRNNCRLNHYMSLKKIVGLPKASIDQEAYGCNTQTVTTSAGATTTPSNRWYWVLVCQRMDDGIFAATSQIVRIKMTYYFTCNTRKGNPNWIG